MRLKQLFKWLGLLSCIFLFACSSSKHIVPVESGWELLGDQKVDFIRDKDAINVTSNTLYSAIRFRVTDQDVRISDMKIQFTNGDKLEPLIDEVVAKDQFSRIIELGSEGRKISKIEFKYRTTGSILKGRADVLVFGQKAYWQ